MIHTQSCSSLNKTINWSAMHSHTSADAQALLSKCYVRQGHHGSGISAALLNEIIDRARSSGVTVMTLGTNQETLRALRFYEKHGFERSGTRTFQVGGTTCQDYVLSRSL